jgi:hypothetical protein
MRRLTSYLTDADDASLSSSQKKGVIIWLGGGLLLLFFSVVFYRLSPAFASSEPILQYPVFAAVTALTPHRCEPTARKTGTAAPV